MGSVLQSERFCNVEVIIWLIFFIEWDEDWMGGRWDLSSALPLLVPLSRLAYKQFICGADPDATI